MKKRLEFCKANLTRCWDSVTFTDRKKFHFTYPGTKVQPVSWLLDGAPREARSVNHALVVNVYAGITRHGVTQFHEVAGTSKHESTYKNKKGKGARNITSSEYGNVVKATLLPEGRRIFSIQGVSTWLLQQDNDTQGCHTCGGGVECPACLLPAQISAPLRTIGLTCNVKWMSEDAQPSQSSRKL